jgi:uncharacterized protein
MPSMSAAPSPPFRPTDSSPIQPTAEGGDPPPTPFGDGARGGRPTAPLEPIGAGERIVLMDVLRGVALLGIFMVNMPIFAMTLFVAFGDSSLVTAPASDRLGWWIVTAGFQFKFISLFSMLFGAGFAMQLMRAEARGHSGLGTYGRRLAALFAIGVVHAFLIWYGDILVVYSIIGVILIPFARVSGRALVRLGIGVLLFSAALGAGTAAGQAYMLSRMDPPGVAGLAERNEELAIIDDRTAAEEAMFGDETERDETLLDDERFDQMLESEVPASAAGGEPRGWQAIVATRGNPMEPLWPVAESAAFREGPFADAFIFRGVLWFYAVASGLFGWLWHVLALFLIGAGLMKSGFFGPDASARRAACAWLVIPGLALELLGAWIVAHDQWSGSMLSSAVTGAHGATAVILTFGYVGLISIAVDAAPKSALVTFIAAPGRMALTCYLSESIFATAIMYWWGLGWFGSVGRMEQIGLVVAIWAVIAVLANLWLSRFRIGPVEWLWRLATYGRPPAWR